MAVQAKEIKERLKSIKNTKKITKTMELVSAAKMRRAIAAAMQSRYYASLAWELMQRLQQSVDAEEHESLKRFFASDIAESENESTKSKHTTIILFTSNRGLCGAFNTNVIKQAFGHITKHANETVDIIAIGKKGVSTLNAYGRTAVMAYEKDDSAKSDASVLEIAEHVYQQFATGKTDQVLIAYTDFVSPIKQAANLKQLFPLTKQDESEATVEHIDNEAVDSVQLPAELEYDYEPSEAALLQYILPRIAVSELYQALLESNASEHSARMLAMKNASDAAGEMAKELNLEYNRARQASITQEIAEIAAGAEAVSG